MKIVFFGTSSVAVPILHSLNLNHEIVTVITSPDAPVGRKRIMTPSPVALAAGALALPLLKPDKVKKNDRFHQQLRDLNADIFIVVSYGKILPPAVIDIPPLKTLNVHFSLLPLYRGAAPIQWAILNGESTTGTTIFVLDELMDHGDIIAQEQTDIKPDDTTESLAIRMSEQSARLLIEVLPRYAAAEIRPRQQDHSKATGTGMISKADGRIDWSKTAQQIYNQYRAFQPWPGIWTTWNERSLKIMECVPHPYKSPISEALPGSMTYNSETKQLLVACGQATMLELTSVQLEGQKPTSPASLLNGRPDFTNSNLI